MVKLEKTNISCQQGEPFCSPSSGTDHRTVVERPPLFSGISAGDCDRIFAAARVREFTRGEMLYVGGDSVRQILLLTAGVAKITQFGMSGTEVILRLCVAGDVLGAMGLLFTGRHCTTAQAFRPCRALVWDASVFKGLVERYPVLHQNMVRILGGYLQELEDRFREVATERVGARVARQLERLREQIGRPVDGSVEIGLSREELAQMTGTTLFTVSRLLSAWEARGIVRARREGVTICDVRSLRTISDSGYDRGGRIQGGLRPDPEIGKGVPAAGLRPGEPLAAG